ncbi:uncharacterized protein LOC105768392 isoform X1 [Gossypium raimondii]|uniref:DUF547 domain-containing protein n=1 Tax=Gossypium raimondii TaxID=29730 RepID=A0A0D2QEF9_GOSRA|nr:uncharacterized protein LOC105768392 isoform X1 [Gossypium raimondii]XP_012443741.1 uncharacterized protein LOC105768392 isoform X1 [Gossypium raimondii]XP_012443742.1 uncharacterized protein LOC105768392 isoform X1 [Gossypium raimondii]XP_052487211.1 uncharacterized protein LOC105768392 isoform X1 [Gossypium raimondii]XP_052487212.1 uncharacterized protein LOC105768392 isoform X1 [Gossypium raimondii]KJB56473.1 hypothetical protein B456_009G121000 [Gossypium raimondii]KJB56474.1 hypotheti
MFDSSLVQSALSQNEGQLDIVSELQDNNSSIEETSYNEETGSVESCSKSSDFYPYRFQLEQDVHRLQQKLQEEIDLHSVLESAIEKNASELSSPSCLPHHAQELLSHIAVLEGTISKLEQEMISLHFQLSQERNERRLAEYRLRHSVSPSMSPSSRCLQHSDSVLHHSSDDNSCQERTDHPSESTGDSSSLDLVREKNAMGMILHHDGKKISAKTDGKSLQPLRFEEISRGITPKGLWDHPNRLSEEMVRCMRNIFISLADSAVPSKSSASKSHSSTLSPRGHLSNSSWWTSSERSTIPSWVQSPQVDIQSNSEVLASENSFDPYRVRGKLSWAEIGNYGLSTEVSWMSVGKQQLEYASGALRKFRTLVEQLAKVNPIHLSCNEKLAFWINLYNALIMHAYLAYGVPRSDLKLFSLMQKAAYTVGGYSFSAAAIEYVILKMKPPLHRPQIALLLALHKLKVSDEQRKSAIDTYEPLVTFALSSGMYSSPAVRIYTAKNVREELEEAQRDFIRASVGVSSKGKLLVPKLLHCFTKGFVDDSNLAVWISHYLPPNQAAFVEQCISQRRQSLLGSRNCGILPFDSRFRYLFLPDKNISIQ